MIVTDFGAADGRTARLYTVENDYLVLKATDFGATIVSLILKGDSPVDMVIGLSSAAEYESGTASLGATVGRVANRIAKARFELGGKQYPLFVNDNGENCLHGGRRGFSLCFHEAQEIENGIRFSRVSENMEEGFPGALEYSVSFTLDGSALKIEYQYQCDAPTFVNLTNHSYFNLNGEGDILNHTLRIAAPLYCRVNDKQIPIVPPESVAGTPFDFTIEKSIGSELDSGCGQFGITKYFDHPYIFGSECAEQAVLTGDKTGIRMVMQTDMPGVQLYCGNFAGGIADKYGRVTPDYAGVCLETQFLPNGMNEANAEMLAEPQKIYKKHTVYAFNRLV